MEIMRRVIEDAILMANLTPTIELPVSHPVRRCKKGKGHGFKQHARADAKRRNRRK